MTSLWDKTSLLVPYHYHTYYRQRFITFVKNHHSHQIPHSVSYQKHLCMRYDRQYTLEAGTLLLASTLLLSFHWRLGPNCCYMTIVALAVPSWQHWRPINDGEYNQKVMSWEADDNARNFMIWGIFTLMLYHLVFLVLFMILFLLFLFWFGFLFAMRFFPNAAVVP